MKRIACLAAALFSLVISFISAGEAYSSFELLRKLKITPNSIDFHLPSRERIEVSGPYVTNIDYGTENAHKDFDRLIESDVLEAVAPKTFRAKTHHGSAPKISGPSELYSLDAEELKRNGRHISNSSSSSHDLHDFMPSGTNLTLATAMLNSSQTQNTNWSIARDVAYPNGSRFGAVTSPNQTLVSAHTRPHLATTRLGIPRSQFGHDRPRRSQDSCNEPGCLPPGSVVKCKKNDTVPITENRPVFLNVFPYELQFRIRVVLWFAKNESMDKRANKTKAIHIFRNTITKINDWYQIKIEATTRFSSNNWTIISTIVKENISEHNVTNYTLDDYHFHRLVISISKGDVLWYVGAAPNCPAFYPPKDDGMQDKLSTTTGRSVAAGPEGPSRPSHTDPQGEQADPQEEQADPQGEQADPQEASMLQLVWLLLPAACLLIAIAAVIILLKRRKNKKSTHGTSGGIRNEGSNAPLSDSPSEKRRQTQITRQMSVNSLYYQESPNQVTSQTVVNNLPVHEAKTQITRQMSVNSLYYQEGPNQVTSQTVVDNLPVHETKTQITRQMSVNSLYYQEEPI
ncbi:uncharacterized protein LOC125179248 [Hyalella azteca]|uniref:Uncharacterized protein LOC125179248 n=1 Tax=Hyalella azteca TaxID=294128 RepID=A0A979FWJ9_HYAAZ|nr:uncharacterized protein LOC125179248 [Hyalella azteca]